MVAYCLCTVILVAYFFLVCVYIYMILMLAAEICCYLKVFLHCSLKWSAQLYKPGLAEKCMPYLISPFYILDSCTM